MHTPSRAHLTPPLQVVSRVMTELYTGRESNQSLTLRIVRSSLTLALPAAHKNQIVEPELWRKWKPFVTKAVVRWMKEHGEEDDPGQNEPDGEQAGQAEQEQDDQDEEEPPTDVEEHDVTDVPDAPTRARNTAREANLSRWALHLQETNRKAAEAGGVALAAVAAVAVAEPVAGNAASTQEATAQDVATAAAAEAFRVDREDPTRNRPFLPSVKNAQTKAVATAAESAKKADSVKRKEMLHRAAADVRPSTRTVYVSSQTVNARLQTECYSLHTVHPHVRTDTRCALLAGCTACSGVGVKGC